MNAPIKIKTKKCKQCGDPFIPRNTIQPTCLKFECQVAYGIQAADRAKQRAEKLQRVELRQRKDAIKTRSEWIKECQIVFNKFIRLRDFGRPCICCGLPLGNGSVLGGQYDCGHYRSVGSAPHLRFDERNAHGQRKQCNRYGSGRAVDYRLGLIARIGFREVEALEADQIPKHYSIEDLKAIKRKYQLAVKSLEKEK
jgi:hypothetical protein